MSALWSQRTSSRGIQVSVETVAFRTTVLIVGGGFAGLTAAAGLAAKGVPVLLAEKHESTSTMPKAWGLATRTQEVLDQIPGLLAELREAATPFGQVPRFLRGRTLAEAAPQRWLNRDGQDTVETLAAISPMGMLGIPQAHTERVLRHRAEQLGADVRFSTTLLDFDQDADGVTARLCDRDGAEYTVHAEYLIAADGHRSPARERLGIPMTGFGHLMSLVGVRFDADLDEWLDPAQLTLCQLDGEDLGGMLGRQGNVQPSLLAAWDEENRHAVKQWSTEQWTALIRRATGMPDLAVSGIAVEELTFSHRIAERSQEGRIFLAGDAAHVMPPTGGMGGNTAIIDGHDLAWRIALVHSGQAGREFLETYQAERLPLGRLVANNQVATMRYRGIPSPEGAGEPLEFIPLMFGQRAHSSSVLAEDEDTSLALDPREHPGLPGLRAPWVPLADGRSTLDLFGAEMVLLTGEGGQPWVDAAKQIELAVHRIAPDADFCTAYGISSEGASLVRPDGVVVWRCTDAVAGPSTTPSTVLTEVLNRVLRRPRADVHPVLWG
ncbi:FAD-binding protein [Pseudonocardiaceae bacterium YIM PH 21723]|nr:FAD-binding protein [Pseudonocardiaceae bacterium YIM PH 21723]